MKLLTFSVILLCFSSFARESSGFSFSSFAAKFKAKTSELISSSKKTIRNAVNATINVINTALIVTGEIQTVLNKTSSSLDIAEKVPIMTCMACRTTFAVLLSQYYYRTRTREETIQDSTQLCLQMSTNSRHVCDSIIRIHTSHVVFYILDHRRLTSFQMCSVLLDQNCIDSDYSMDLEVNVAPQQAAIAPKIDFSPRNSDELKILHITDIHYDPKYLVGSNANCPDPLCCRIESGIAADLSDQAGQWGDYRRCGTPWNAVENAIRSAGLQHPDADLIYVTGDYVHHALWDLTQQGNVEIFDKFFELLKDVFGDKKVFLTLGNHDTHPTNAFAPPNITSPMQSTKWLYEHAATSWSHWLPNSTQSTILHGGYYTVLLPNSKLRIVALNNNDCYHLNFWVLYSTFQLTEQLQWLHDTLFEAEKAGEFVHIITHIASSSCLSFWARKYRLIIDRFYKIIGGQFFGHEHFDEFMVFYSSDEHQVPINVGWNGGAITTHSGANPNYNVYYVDRDYYQVVEKESWSYNLAEANLNPTANPAWTKLYDFTKHFEIPNLSPAALDDFVTNKLAKSRQLLSDYQRYRVSNSSFILAKECDDDCLRKNLCQITVSEVTDRQKCDKVCHFELN